MNKNVKYIAFYPYNFEELKAGMKIYHLELDKNLTIINIYKEPKIIYFKEHYGGIRYKYGCFYPLINNMRKDR